MNRTIKKCNLEKLFEDKNIHDFYINIHSSIKQPTRLVIVYLKQN